MQPAFTPRNHKKEKCSQNPRGQPQSHKPSVCIDPIVSLCEMHGTGRSPEPSVSRPPCCRRSWVSRIVKPTHLHTNCTLPDIFDSLQESWGIPVHRWMRRDARLRTDCLSKGSAQIGGGAHEADLATAGRRAVEAHDGRQGVAAPCGRAHGAVAMRRWELGGGAARAIPFL